jgi:DNA-binding response OmpR family regulator
VEATREIKQRWPEVCVLAFTSTGEVRRVAPMLDAGARGWVFKGQSHEDLVAHIRTSIRDRGRSRRPVPGKIFLAAPGATSGVGSPFAGGEGHVKGGRSGLRRLLLLPQRSDPNRYGREG